MNRTEIISNIENIATTAKDEQIRLNALTLLLNNDIIIEKEMEAKSEKEKSEERICNMQKDLFAITGTV